MPGHDIVVIGASAGGIQALQDLFGGIPSDVPASFFVVVHTGAQSAGLLPLILSRRSPFIAEYPTNGAPIRRQRIYVAPPDHHLLLRPDRICVVRGQRKTVSDPRWTRCSAPPPTRTARA